MNNSVNSPFTLFNSIQVSKIYIFHGCRNLKRCHNHQIHERRVTLFRRLHICVCWTYLNMLVSFISKIDSMAYDTLVSFLRCTGRNRGSCKTAFDNMESLDITTRIRITSDSCKIKNLCAKFLLRLSLFLLFFEKLSMKSLGNFVSSLNTNWLPVLRSFCVPPFKLCLKYWSAAMSVLSALISTPKLIIFLYTLVENSLNALNVCWTIILTINDKSTTKAELFPCIFGCVSFSNLFKISDLLPWYSDLLSVDILCALPNISDWKDFYACFCLATHAALNFVTMACVSIGSFGRDAIAAILIKQNLFFLWYHLQKLLNI